MRPEDLNLYKQRALDYLDRGELGQAVASLGNDLRNHPEYCNRTNDARMILGMLYVINGNELGVRRWIEDFH
jgi:hypothetical protein